MLLKDRPLLRAADAPLFVANLSAVQKVKAAVDLGLNVVVTGAPGTGKSSLLARVLSEISSSQDVYQVYAAGADTGAALIEAVAEDVAGPPSVRRHKSERMLEVALGRVVTAPSERGRVMAAIDRLAAALTFERLEDSPGSEPVILLDAVARRSASQLFTTYADALAKVPANWVVSIENNLMGSTANPSARFFDQHVELTPPPFEDAVAVVQSRTGLPADMVAERLSASTGNPMELRSLIMFAQQLRMGVPVGEDDFEQRRKNAIETLARLGRPAAMLVAEMKGRGPVSPSDEALLQRMGWKRARASELLSALHRAELVTYTEQRGPDGGRPRRLYELVPELQ